MSKTEFRDPVLADIEAYLAATGTGHAQFGALAASDPSLVAELRAGRELRSRTREKIRTWLQAHRPKRRRATKPRAPRSVAAAAASTTTKRKRA